MTRSVLVAVCVGVLLTACGADLDAPCRDGDVCAPSDGDDLGTQNGDEEDDDEELAGVGLRDGASYEIRRSDVAQCVDVRATLTDNVGNESNDVVQMTCDGGSAQRFWAVERDVGAFALMNAVSGRCLDVIGGSLSDGGNVILLPCTFAPNQLWVPERVGPGIHRLTNRLSGKVLESSGEQFPKDGQGGGFFGDIQQWTDLGKPDMRWRLTPTTSAAHIALEPFTAVGQSVRVDPDSGFAARVAADTSSLSAFRIVPGLGDRNGVSFELKARPGMYLHDDDGALVGAVDDETVAFKDSATFTVREDLRGEVDPRFRSFDIYKQPGRYLVELDGVLQLAETTGAQAFQDGATFRFVSRD